MKFFWDLDRGELLAAPRGHQIKRIAIKRGQTGIPIEVFWVRGRHVIPTTPLEVSFGLKQSKGDEDALAIANTPAPHGEGVILYLNTTTAELKDALGEKDSDDFPGEFRFKLSTGTQASQDVIVRVTRPVFSGEEGTPSALPDADDFVAARSVLYDREQTLTGEQRDQARENIAADIACRFENRAPSNGAKATTPLFLGSLFSLTADTTGAAQNGYQLHLEEVTTPGPAAMLSPTPTSATIRVNPAYYDGMSKTTTDLAADINGMLDYVLHPFSVTSLASMACPTGWTAITATTSGGIDTDTPAAPGQRWIWPSQGRVWVATSLAPTLWQELGLQGQDFVGAAISGTSLTSSGGALVLGSGAAHSQLLSGATGLRINTLPDRTGTLATLNGAQTFTDTITFAGAVAVNGQLTAPNQGFAAESGVLTKALGRRLMPFIDARSTRQIIETFVAGTTADGSVGQWGWSTAAEGTGALSYQQAAHVPIGRKLRLLTGTVANQRIYIAGRPSLATAADSYSAITFVFNLTNTYTWDDMRLRFGWSDTTVPYSGGSNYALVEYDASVGASWRYRFDPSSGGSGEVISAIGAHNNTDNNSRAQAITLVGALYNERKLGGQANHARIIVTTFNVAGAAAHQHSVEVNLASAGALFNARPYVELATLTNAAKSVELSMVASDFSVVLAMASNGGPM